MNPNDTPEPHSDPPDERAFCNNPDCDSCNITPWAFDCPGVDPDHEEEQI